MTFPRQPDQVVIVPSNPSPWYGFPAEGQRFTHQQLSGWARLGRDGDIEAITVFREANNREMWWGIEQAPPVFQFDCPVIKRLGDGRVRVISPYGMEKIVLATGWVRDPHWRNQHLLPEEHRTKDWRKRGRRAGQRVGVSAAVLGALLLGSMLFRGVIAAPSEHTPSTKIVATVQRPGP